MNWFKRKPPSTVPTLNVKPYDMTNTQDLLELERSIAVELAVRITRLSAQELRHRFAYCQRVNATICEEMVRRDKR